MHFQHAEYRRQDSGYGGPWKYPHMTMYIVTLLIQYFNGLVVICSETSQWTLGTPTNLWNNLYKVYVAQNMAFLTYFCMSVICPLNYNEG